jgi:hypothetical protein
MISKHVIVPFHKKFGSFCADLPFVYRFYDLADSDPRLKLGYVRFADFMQCLREYEIVFRRQNNNEDPRVFEGAYSDSVSLFDIHTRFRPLLLPELSVPRSLEHFVCQKRPPLVAFQTTDSDDEWHFRISDSNLCSIGQQVGFFDAKWVFNVLRLIRKERAYWIKHSENLEDPKGKLIAYDANGKAMPLDFFLTTGDDPEWRWAGGLCTEKDWLAVN